MKPVGSIQEFLIALITAGLNSESRGELNAEGFPPRRVVYIARESLKKPS
jgi:hypothetical protein